jgi:hypothetical protein
MCLYRACLGRIVDLFYEKWLQKQRIFAPIQLLRRGNAKQEAHMCERRVTNAKTGSGHAAAAAAGNPHIKTANTIYIME